MGEAEGVKDFQSTWLETISLSSEDLGGSLINDSGIDTKASKPKGCHVSRFCQCEVSGQ
jgi:hypothetical protein